ncbi:MAG: hypothetical protein ACRC4P_04845 [Aeromonas sp.]
MNSTSDTPTTKTIFPIPQYCVESTEQADKPVIQLDVVDLAEPDDGY